MSAGTTTGATTVPTTDTTTGPPRRPDFGHRAVVVRAGAFSVRLRVRSLVVCSVLVAGVLAVTTAALGTGTVEYSPAEVLAALLNDPDAGFARVVVVEWRMPRALAAVVFGAALGVAGAIFQSLTRNPLASPDIIGFTTGSYTGALVVITLAGGGGYFAFAGGALAGGFLTASAVYLLAWSRGVQGFRLIVVGIAISAMLGSFNTWLMLNADLEVALSAAVWGTGSLNSTTWEQVGYGSLAIVLLLLACAALGPALRQSELGDDAASATGLHSERVRLAATVVGVALAAAVTASAGPITFVALAAPQIARRLTRSPGVALAPAACMGALLLAAADFTSQHLLPLAVPVGVVTVVVGGTYLVALIVMEVRRRD